MKKLYCNDKTCKYSDKEDCINRECVEQVYSNPKKFIKDGKCKFYSCIDSDKEDCEKSKEKILLLQGLKGERKV